ncbi:MAG: hypothetical protein ACRD2C_20645 [Acidimicrobiales bacterium]
MRLTTIPPLLAAAALALVPAGCGSDDDTDASPGGTTGGPGATSGTVTVTAAEYSFDGLPDTLDAGETTFELVNEGQEVHELIVYRRNDGTTQPVEELLTLPDDQVLELVTPVTTVEQFTALPSETATGAVDLDPGDYIALCFVPVGLTDFESEPPAGAAPHAAHGMVAEFTVR